MTMRPPVTFQIPPGATVAKCTTCHASIYWVLTSSHRRMPVNLDGVSHFATCPHAAVHRRPR